MMASVVKRRMLTQMFGGSPTVSLGTADLDLTTHTPTTFSTDDEKATLAIYTAILNVPVGMEFTHVRIWQGSELQWIAPLPETLYFANARNRADWQPGEIVLYL